MIQKNNRYFQITNELAAGNAANARCLINEFSDELTTPEKYECEGNLKFYEGQYDEAYRIYEDILENFSDYPVSRYYYIAATRLEATGDMKLAFDYYRSAIEAEETFVDTYIDLAGFLAKIDDKEGAVRCLERAIEFEPNDIRVFSNLLDLYRSLSESGPEIYQKKFDQLKSDMPNIEKKLGTDTSDNRW